MQGDEEPRTLDASGGDQYLARPRGIIGLSDVLLCRVMPCDA